jgi:spore coat polysaccharide biosynthesis predicted glycosyltransferase SpsG
VNANLHAGELKFRFEGKAPHMLLGGNYALLRREFRELAPFNTNEKANRVFVCFGGSDLRNITPKVIRALKDIESIQISVVLGELTKCDEDVFAFAGKNVSVYKTPDSISGIMRQCDIAVTAAGSMVYELAALGIPTITIVQANNQILIADYLSRNGLMRCVGNWENYDFAFLRNETEALLGDYNRRKSESNKLIQTVDRNGAMNAAKAVLAFAANGSS